MLLPAPFNALKLAFIVPLFILLSCKQKPAVLQVQATDSLTTTDPHTLARPGLAVVKHLELTIKVDFIAKQISGKASWTIDNIAKGNEIIFDNNGLTIQKVTLGSDEKETKYTIGDTVKYLGTAIYVSILPDTRQVNIYYSTNKGAAALQWLDPQQTAGKKLPFLFTQSESILARTWVPCQDSPGIRFTYNATVTVPKDLLALMSAVNPQYKNKGGIYHFTQVHAIPSYLLALSVGDIAFKPVDARTGVYAEPSVVGKAAWEFADVGKMVDAAEKLYGPYRWGRYDLIILPPSFPYGGMENPNLTFATPTVIAGDRSLVSLVSHELAHSWSGNLVTNATWNDMWLNEGFTTYFQRRIDESVYGRNEADMQEVLARQTLDSAIASFGKNNPDTRLKVNFNGRNPEDAGSDIAYEKGFFFLKTIETIIGRDKFDPFLRHYFDSHAFQSRTTEQFLADLNKDLLHNDTTLMAKIDEKGWVYSPGIPANIAPVHSKVFDAIDNDIKRYGTDHEVAGLSKSIVTSNEKQYFIKHLPAPLSVKDMAGIDAEFKFTQSHNTDIQLAWYVLAIRYHYTAADKNIEAYLLSNGRRGHIVPLYSEMIKTPQGKLTAKRIYAKARPGYHPVTYQTIDGILK